MADLSITAANVIAGTGASGTNGLAGAAITAGQAVYLDKVTQKYLLSDSNSGVAAARAVDGLALHAAALNQPLAVHTKGPIAIGATLAPGVAYYLSDTPGGICPVADVGTGENSILIGIATSASVLKVNVQNSGVTL
ncbi:hypothetical protein WG907_04365 [Sphingobium sp. AN558]|uniref:hypothetical protein n=1 Tax=Sphingobium sp. AN558 TaxID=3133442 RepID=UPI0030BD5662